MRPFTVVRSHFGVALRSDQAAAIETQAIGFGLAVVSDTAVGIGVTAVPTPITDLASSLFFVHRLIYADESNLTDRTRGQTVVSIDSKAMRKVELGEDIVLTIENAGLTSFGFVTTIGGRMLVKNN